MFHNPDKSFEQADANEDGVLDKSELSLGISHLGDILLTGKDLDDLIKDLELDADQDGVLTRQEYRTLVVDGKLQLIINYTADIKEKAPRMRTRLSNTAFLDPLEHVGHRKLFDNLRQRIQDVTGLQKDIIWTSENLQVLRYDKDGHYHCHYDSEDENKHPDIPCCHYSNHEDDEDCLPCRYMTFFYYLNEPEEGGETAFPIADDQIDAPERMLREDQHLCDLSRYCNQSRIRYKPKQGTALFWYNHHRDEETGWLGDVDKMSYHGGCDVTKGTKWAANSWINVGKSREHDIEAWESYKVFVEDYDKLSNKTDEKTDVDANPGPGAVAENAERASEVDERIETAGAGN
ncbi:transmembrane prolyl 4-hydroxylase isoform X2 [Nematostella vectensis]|nr:transmembrane prolyl 4-hydroxylase isoform X2 [Nematostella vectensis]